MAETIANLVKSLQEKISKFEGRPYSHSFTPLKVIVLGGAGYIGSAVVDHFSRAGHQVYAVVRSESHRAQIEKLEANVLIGNSQELETKFQDILDQADVVVDTVADNTDMETAIKSLNATIASAKRNPAKRKRFIMTSGCLIYQGKDPEQIFTETAVTDTPLLAGRVKTEKAVTESKDVDGIAMRVAFVYGGSHGHYGQGNWISGAFDEQGNSVVIGDPNKKYSWIHIHDLAEAYLRVAEAPAKVVSHQIYNISDDTNVSIKQLIEAGRALFPTKPGTGIIFKPAGTDFFSQLLETNARASHDKLAGHLGWHPRHIDMMQNLKLYAAGFKAHHARVAKAEHSSAQTAQEPLEKPKPKEEVKAAEPAKEEVKAAEPAKEEVKEQPKQEQQQQQPKQQQQQQGGGKKKNRK